MLGLFAYWKARKDRNAVNRGSAASDPGGLRMSDARLKRLCPTLYYSTGIHGMWRCFFADGMAMRFYIRDMLIHGDSRAAVVLSESPLLVACYCDDLDGVCVLRFPDELAKEHGLHPGSQLLTVLNSMSTIGPALPDQIAPDLVQGENANPCYINFWPMVAEFLSDDSRVINGRKEEIDDDEFDLCQELGEEHLRRYHGEARDGRPDRSMNPAGEWPTEPWW